jgi:AbrB family looped-hinge helix DNA binding protein
MEKRIRVSTQGRLTIPKIIRDKMRIQDGQSVIIRSDSEKRELVIELIATMSDFASH